MLGARDKQVCARLARCGSAWRRSRGALERMGRMIASALLALAPVAALGASPWQEDSRLTARVAVGQVEALRVAVEDALIPLGFHRDASGDEHPANLIQGLLATLSADTHAHATMHEAVTPGCVTIFVSNYDRARRGSAGLARKDIKKALGERFGGAIHFYADVGCKHAL